MNKQQESRPIIRNPIFIVLYPSIHPNILYKSIPCMRVMMMPPKNNIDLLLLHRLIKLKEVNAVAVRKTACIMSSGSCSTKMLIRGPIKNPS